MKNRLTHLWCYCAILTSLTWINNLQAEYLFNQFIDPGYYGSNSEFSQWDVFGPVGSSFSGIAVTPDLDSPLSPPTIMQTIPGAFIGSTNGNWNDNIGSNGGNAYSFSSNMSFILDDTTSYGLTSVVFQYQASGSTVDLSSVRLVVNGNSYYATGSNAEYIQEWAGGAASFAGLDNRVAIQWNLSSLGLTGPTTYQILFDAPVHTSFQRALLDTTSSPFTEAVAAARTWIQGGGPNLTWNTSNHWAEGSAPTAQRGNIIFANTTSANIALGENPEVAELIFQGSDVTINGAQTLTTNTGITVDNAGAGTYTINSNYRIGSTNMMNIKTGSTVRINGVVSGNFGGLVKEGGGFLDLTNSNTFNGTAAGAISSVEVYEGTLRFGGSNQYAGTTTVLFGKLIVAANAAHGSGALGTSTSNVTIGASGFFSGSPSSRAELFLEGDVTMGRNITLSDNQSIKTLGATATTTGATYSGEVKLSASGNANFVADSATDTATFSGAITGGSNTSAGGVVGGVTAVNIGGSGTVVFSGINKTYTGNTTVQSGAHLKLNTTLAGTGNFDMTGGTLSGIGTLKKNLVVDAGDSISPGNSIGRFTIGEAAATQQLTFASGGKYQWELSNATGSAGSDWDHLQLYGSLDVTSNSADPFTIALSAISSASFNPMQDYDWVILSASNGITNFNSSSFNLDTSAFDLETFGNFTLLQNNNDLVIRYVHVVPEPTKTLLLLFGLAAATMHRRRSSSSI